MIAKVEAPPAMETPYTIHTSTLFDPKKKAFLSNMSVTVDPKTGLIVDYYERKDSTEIGTSVPIGDVDLRGKVVMPGIVDAHTHIFLHSYELVFRLLCLNKNDCIWLITHSERPSLVQKRDESIPERIIRATHHVRTALLAGCTTYR